MTYFPSKGTSLWVETAEPTTYAPLAHSMHCDVAIIGGGIAGLTAAYLLKMRGKKVAVSEKHTIGAGVTGFTTGKISAGHGIIYHDLIKKHGRTVASQYAQMNQAALGTIQQIVEDNQLKCDFRIEDNYIFSEDADEASRLRREVEAAQAVGLKVQFVTTTPLPFKVAGAIKYPDQATFHIGKYLQGLARLIHGDGSYVFEDSKAGAFHDGEPARCRVNGVTVTADALVHATNAPYALKDHAAYGVAEYPMRSYIVAGKVRQPIAGMYISSDRPTRSILPAQVNGQDWLLIGGDGHFTGKSGPARNHYDHLAEYARRFGVESIDYEWSTWDFVGYDDLPIFRKLYPWSKGTYVITALRKWGLTNATAGAAIVADAITGHDNPNATTFRSNRASLITSLPGGIMKGLLS